MKKAADRSTPPKKKMPPMSKCVREVDANLGLGALSLVNKRITSLEGLGVQKNLVKLYLQNNCLESFEFLSSQPHLKELYAQNNFIKSFKGLELQQSLQILGISGNPICSQPLCRVMALLAVGSTLRKIDDDMISQVERMTASRLSPKAALAVRLGAIIDYKRRSEEDFDQLIDKLSGKPKRKLLPEPNLIPDTPPPPYSPPRSTEPKIDIIYKGKPPLPKKESEEDLAQEELILRTLKQIEEADLADDEFVVEVEDDDEMMDNPNELSQTPNSTKNNEEEQDREEEEEGEREEDKETNGNNVHHFDFGLSQTIPQPQTPPQPHQPPQLPPLPLHHLHHYNQASVNNIQNNTTPHSAHGNGKDEGKSQTPKSQTPKSQTPKTVDRELAMLREQAKEMEQLKEKLKGMEQLKEKLKGMEKLKDKVKQLEKALTEERNAKLQYEESLNKTEEILDEERGKSNSLVEHVAELTDRCNELIESNEQLHQEKLEVVAISTQGLLAEREQRKLIEEKYEEKNSPTKGAGRKSGDTEFVSAKEMCSIDTIQFYTVIRKDSQNISACISFHDDGISLMNTETAQAMEFPLQSSVEIVKDTETLMTLFGNNHQATLNDKRIDLIAQLITYWLSYKN